MHEESAMPSTWRKASLIAVEAGCADLRELLSRDEKAHIGLTRIDALGAGAVRYELWFDPAAPAVESTRCLERVLLTLLKQQAVGKLIGLKIEALVNEATSPTELPPSNPRQIA